MPDHYTYRGTEVLINKLGLTDPGEWKAVETAAVGQRMIELQLAPISGSFDLPHLQAIHRHLTQDLYAWGGRLRDTDTGPAGTGIAHCRPAYIPQEADRIFTALAGMDLLRGRDVDAFCEALAWVWGETTVLHPFRDVNTRSQFVFFNQLARAAGWGIDWTQIDPHLFAHARTLAIVRDETGIDALLHPALTSVEEIDRDEELHQTLRDAQAGFFTSGRRRTPAQLDRELRTAVERRARRRDA